jgi:hypothetical protein
MVPKEQVGLFLQYKPVPGNITLYTKGADDPSGVPKIPRDVPLSSISIVPAPAVQFAENPKILAGPAKITWLAEVLVIRVIFTSTGYVLII